MRRRTANVGVAGVALLGALAVWVVATELFPYHSVNHDEAVYLQQAAMLLEGQLSLYPPLENVFRPWFFVDAGDRLYPKYAPVPAAMFALGKLAGAYRLALPAIAAGTLALLAGVVGEAFDRRTGIAAALFALASPLFLLDSSVFLPYAPTTLLNLLFAFAYLRGDRTGDRRWAAVAGAAAGLAFFARPYTAVLFAAPFVCHALWTLRRDPFRALPRQATTATLGLAGVAVALAYNAAMTGDALTFPYQAFAPLDGLGFGQRRILGHSVDYTVELALRANARVLASFATDWVAGGVLGTALAAGGLALAVRRGLSPRQTALAGLLVSIPVGNVYFWGNYNILGDLERTGDGLIAVLGPYYHFDLLVPFAAFAAVGALALVDRVRETATARLDRRHALAVTFAVAVLGAGVLAGVTVGNAAAPVERNAAATDTYETAYAPFADGPPANSLIFVPTPYGDWLNHPFQLLRNDPGFDGRAVYAIDDRPFEVVAAFPERTVYRYTYRGPWDPLGGSPSAARLQRVEHVSGRTVALNATVGVPSDANSVTVRVGTDGGETYVVRDGARGAVRVRLHITGDRVAVLGTDGQVTGSTPVSGRESVLVTAFVDYGPGGSFTYRLEVPVDATGETVRALSPHVELCRGVRTCGGAATYVPTATSDGVFVETALSVVERNA